LTFPYASGSGFGESVESRSDADPDPKILPMLMAGLGKGARIKKYERKTRICSSTDYSINL